MGQKVEDLGDCYAIWCNACDEYHSFNKERWLFNGDMDHPTFAPSLVVTITDRSGNIRRRCHSFVRDGCWEYLDDCTHSLKGQTVAIGDT